jgi:hypothetical protein
VTFKDNLVKERVGLTILMFAVFDVSFDVLNAKFKLVSLSTLLRNRAPDHAKRSTEILEDVFGRLELPYSCHKAA